MTVINPPQIAVISISAEDIPTCVHFYKDVIGLQLDQHHAHRPAFNLGENLFLVIVKGKLEMKRNLEQDLFPMLAFAVDDLTDAMARLRSHGVDFPWGIEKEGDSRWVLFYDTEGNLLEFVQFAASSHQ